MSQENVEIVRAANEALLAGNIETALDALDPDIEWHATVGGTGTVNTVRDGRIVRVRSYMDRRQALEAAGLRE